jgi:hypothetical protein
MGERERTASLGYDPRIRLPKRAPVLGIEPSSHALTERPHTLCVNWYKLVQDLFVSHWPDPVFALQLGATQQPFD